MPSALDSAGKYFRPLGGDGYSNAIMPTSSRSPHRSIATEFPDYPSTRETEIH